MTNYKHLHTKKKKKSHTQTFKSLLLTTVKLMNQKTKWEMWVSVTTSRSVPHFNPSCVHLMGKWWENEERWFYKQTSHFSVELRKSSCFVLSVSETLAAHSAMTIGWFHIFSFLILFIIGNLDTAAGVEDVTGDSNWDNLPLRQHKGQKYWNSVTGRLKQTNQWKAIIDLFVL